jgi:hypothetical protein
LSKDQQDKLISDAAFLNEIEKNYFDGKISCFSKRGQGYFQNIRESQAPHQLVRRVEVELHSRVTMRTFPACVSVLHTEFRSAADWRFA